MIPKNWIPPERVTDLLNRVIQEPPAYISQNILTRGGTLLLGGEAKTGKSFLMLELARALTTGKSFLNNSAFSVPMRAKVIYIEAENGEVTTQKRIREIFKDEDPRVYGDYFFHRSKNLDYQLDARSGIEYFVQDIQAVRPNVIILDPISFMFHKDENDATEVGKLYLTLARLKELGADENTSIVMAHHFKKPPTGDAAEGYDFLSEYNFRGSSKWKDGGDSLITMHRGRTYRHPDNSEWWSLKMRFLTRHGSSPPEGWYAFNQKDDLRIRAMEGKESLAGGRVALPKLKLVRPVVQQDINWGLGAIAAEGKGE